MTIQSDHSCYNTHVSLATTAALSSPSGVGWEGSRLFTLLMQSCLKFFTFWKAEMCKKIYLLLLRQESHLQGINDLAYVFSSFKQIMNVHNTFFLLSCGFYEARRWSCQAKLSGLSYKSSSATFYPFPISKAQNKGFGPKPKGWVELSPNGPDVLTRLWLQGKVLEHGLMLRLWIPSEEMEKCSWICSGTTSWALAMPSCWWCLKAVCWVS